MGHGSRQAVLGCGDTKCWRRGRYRILANAMITSPLSFLPSMGCRKPGKMSQSSVVPSSVVPKLRICGMKMAKFLKNNKQKLELHFSYEILYRLNGVIKSPSISRPKLPCRCPWPRLACRGKIKWRFPASHEQIFGVCFSNHVFLSFRVLQVAFRVCFQAAA